jgi:hypothetical protein
MTNSADIPSPLQRVRALGLANKAWFNAIWFQTTWFICVLGRDPWAPAALAMIAIHFALVANPRRELVALAPIIATGVIVDASLSRTGVFDFGGELVPLWLCLLWVAFATTLSRAMAPLGKYRWLTVLIGGIGVPFNYAVGAKMGAVALPLEPWITAVTLVSIWAILLPVLFVMSGVYPTKRQILTAGATFKTVNPLPKTDDSGSL